MWRRAISGLAFVAAAVIAVSWSTSASAGCKNIGGTLYCAAWITGSEVQLSTITGLGNIKDTCPNGSPIGTAGCPIVTASVYGTGGTGETPSCNPANGASCAITGVLYCTNPAENAAKARGQPFALNAVLSDTAIVDGGDCTRNGKCTETVEVEADFSVVNPCINSNWNPVSFVASEFYGLSQLDWIDNKGNAQTIKILDFCTVQLGNSYKPGQMYTCTQLTLP